MQLYLNIALAVSQYTINSETPSKITFALNVFHAAGFYRWYMYREGVLVTFIMAQ